MLSQFFECTRRTMKIAQASTKEPLNTTFLRPRARWKTREGSRKRRAVWTAWDMREIFARVGRGNLFRLPVLRRFESTWDDSNRRRRFVMRSTPCCHYNIIISYTSYWNSESSMQSYDVWNGHVMDSRLVPPPRRTKPSRTPTLL